MLPCYRIWEFKKKTKPTKQNSTRVLTLTLCWSVKINEYQDSGPKSGSVVLPSLPLPRGVGEKRSLHVASDFVVYLTCRYCTNDGVISITVPYLFQEDCLSMGIFVHLYIIGNCDRMCSDTYIYIYMYVNTEESQLASLNTRITFLDMINLKNLIGEIYVEIVVLFTVSLGGL